MRKTKRKSIKLSDLTMYIEDLLRMGFVSQHKDDTGKKYYKLTKLGIKSGLEEFSN